MQQEYDASGYQLDMQLHSDRPDLELEKWNEDLQLLQRWSWINFGTRMLTLYDFSFDILVLHSII